MSTSFCKIRAFSFVILLVFALLVLLTACSTLISDNASTQTPWNLNTTWVYTATRYAGFNSADIMTATWIITETIVEQRAEGPYLAFRICRDESAETVVSVDTDAFMPVKVADSSDYWLVMTDTHQYRLVGGLNLDDPGSVGELALVFPLEVDEKWYLNREMSQLYPDKAVDSMLRKVLQESPVTVPAGDFAGCFLLAETIGGSTFDGWYCPAVGWVERGSDHHGTPYGWREVLIDTYVGK